MSIELCNRIYTNGKHCKETFDSQTADLFIYSLGYFSVGIISWYVLHGMNILLQGTCYVV